MRIKKIITSLIVLFSVFVSNAQATIATDAVTGFDCIAVGESCGVFPTELTLFQGKILFTGASAINGDRILWEYDGITATPLTMPHEYVSSLAAFDSILLFRGSISNDYELWKYNGNSVSLIADINSTTSSNPDNFTTYKNKVYFRAYHPDSSGLWVYDPTNLVQPIADAYSGGACSWSSSFINYMDTLYFSANGGTMTGVELWKLDGVNSPVIAEELIVGPVSSNLTPLIEFQGKLICSGDNTFVQDELWKYDGVNAPVQIPNSNSFPWQASTPIIFNTNLYFIGNNGVNGRELIKYDGVNAPSIVFDINPNGDAGIFDIIEYNGYLYFGADDGVNGKELWRYDGVNQPELYQDIYTGSLDSAPSDFIIYNNDLYFSACDSLNGCELWVLRQNASLDRILPTLLSIYPSPTKDFLTVKLSIDSEELTNAKIYNLSSQLILAAVISNTKSSIDITNLEEGMYVIMIELNNGRIINDKFMVK